MPVTRESYTHSTEQSPLQGTRQKNWFERVITHSGQVRRRYALREVNTVHKLEVWLINELSVHLVVCPHTELYVS